MLCKRLGEWYTPLDENNRKWQSYVNTITKEIFVPIHEGALQGHWKQIIATSERTNSLSFMSNTSMRLLKILPKECIPADIYHDGLKCTVKYNQGVNHTTETQDDKEEGIRDWESAICQNLSLKRTHEDIQHCMSIAKANFCIVTDGGTYEYNGTFGAVITHEETMLATNHGKLYSPEFYESSYRLEIFALLEGIISFRYMMGKNNQTTERTINIYCENKSLINRINSR
jgi:hypothetical protein